MKEPECCEKCYFWKLDDDDEEGERTGLCRRYPPVSVLTDSSVAEWDNANPWDGRFWSRPRVLETNWCGEFARIRAD